MRRCSLVECFVGLAAIFATSIMFAAKRKVELLSANGAPGATGNSDNDKPTLSINLPKIRLSWRRLRWIGDGARRH